MIDPRALLHTRDQGGDMRREHFFVLESEHFGLLCGRGLTPPLLTYFSAGGALTQLGCVSLPPHSFRLTSFNFSNSFMGPANPIPTINKLVNYHNLTVVTSG